MTLPIADLINERMTILGLDRERLGYRLGYTNPIKAAGRVQALCDGFIDTRKSLRAMHRLPAALEVQPEDVGRAVTATRAIFAERERERLERIRKAAKEEDATYRQSFRPHAILHTERTRPSGITIFVLSGGPARWLIIPLDETQPPVTYAGQALDGIAEVAQRGENGNLYQHFFGKVLGVYVNYSPDRAVRFDLDGNPVEVLDQSYRVGRATVTIGGKTVTPELANALLGGAQEGDT